MITKELVARIVAGSSMPWSPWHGVRHWRTVAANGAAIQALGAECDPIVVTLFALFHDSQRENDGRDDGHGYRGGEYAAEILAGRIDHERLVLLAYACAFHEQGGVSEEPTVAVCWDSDRLDLPRVGVEVDPGLLSTEEARRLSCVP